MSNQLQNMCFIAGCGKCGTTTLASLLDSHPLISLASGKEPNFFSRDTEYAKGLEYYQAMFDLKKSAYMQLDASVCYTLLDTEKKVAERIKQTCVKPKFIYIARNPYKRLESIFCEAHNNTHNSKIDMPYDLKGAIKYNWQMLFNSLYWQRTEEIRSSFPETDILYLTLEDLEADQSGTVERCLSFLDLNETLPLSNSSIHLNKSSAKTYEPLLLRKIRKANDAYKFLPEKIHRFLQQKMRRPVSELDLTWDEEMRYFVKILFREEVRNYLHAAGKSPSFWGDEFL